MRTGGRCPTAKDQCCSNVRRFTIAPLTTKQSKPKSPSCDVLATCSTSTTAMAGATYTHIDNDDDDDAPIPAALECPICRSAFDNPVMLLPCAHLFCRACLQASLDVAPLCPLDRLPVAVAPQTDSVLQPAPRNIQQLLDALPTAAHCDECGWRGRRDAAQHHLCTVRCVPLCNKGLQQEYSFASLLDRPRSSRRLLLLLLLLQSGPNISHNPPPLPAIHARLLRPPHPN